MNFSQKSIFTIIGKFFGAFLALLSSIFLARYLGVSGIGQYQLIISVQVISITIIAMGFGNASIFFINNKKINKSIIVTNILKFFSIIALIFLLVLYASLLYFPSYFGDLCSLEVLVFSVGSASLLLFNLLLPILYASLQVVKAQILSLLSVIVVLVGLSLFYRLDFFDINTVLLIIGISNVIPFLLLLFFLKEDINFNEKIDFYLLKEIFFYGIQISATNLVFLLSSNLVVFLLKSLLDDGFEVVGLFSRATAIANMFVLIPSSIGPLIYSKWSSKNSTDLHLEVEKTLRILSLVAFSSIVAIFVFGEFILNLLYGKEFLLANSALSILSVSIIFSTIVIILSNLFSSIGKPEVTLKVFIGSLVVSTVLGFIIIPHYNIVGAAISVLFGVFFNAITLLYFTVKEINLSIPSSIFIRKSDLKWLKTNLFKRK